MCYVDYPDLVIPRPGREGKHPVSLPRGGCVRVGGGGKATSSSLLVEEGEEERALRKASSFLVRCQKSETARSLLQASHSLEEREGREGPSGGSWGRHREFKE